MRWMSRRWKSAVLTGLPEMKSRRDRRGQSPYRALRRAGIEPQPYSVV